MITSVGGFECGLEWEAVPCCPYRWHKRLIYLPSHQSGASSSVTKNLLLISNPNCKKSFPACLSMRSPRAALISPFAALVRHRLKSVWSVGWGEVRAEKAPTELLYYFASFDWKCRFTLLEKPSVFGLVWLILSADVWGGSERLRWRLNAVEITACLSLPSPFFFFF